MIPEPPAALPVIRIRQSLSRFSDPLRFFL